MILSSNLKKIISFVAVCVVLLNAMALPVFAVGEGGDWGDGEWHEAYEDFSDAPRYTESDLVYTGDVTTNVCTDFNLIKMFGLDWTYDNSVCYMSRPFQLRKRWDQPSNILTQIGTDNAILKKMFSRDYFESISTSSYVTSNNIDISSYNVYYTLRTSYSSTREYGFLTLDYWFVPQNRYIAISNQNKEEDGSGEVWYGIWLSSENELDYNYKDVFHATTQFRTESGSLTSWSVGACDKCFYDFLGMSHLNLVATNIPIFLTKDSAKNHVMTGKITEDPTNKIPNAENEKIGADAFYWDSLKCRLVQVGGQYKAIFDYSYSATDMVNNPSEYHMNVDYTQTYKYKLSSTSNVVDDRYKQDSTALNIGASPGSITDAFTEMNKSAYGTGTGILLWIGQGLADVFGVDRDLTSITLYSSYITVYVELVHVIDGGNGLSVKDKVSSDIRSFTFDALTLKSLDDTSDIEPVSQDKVEVTTKDTVDSDGNVTDRTVTGSTVINNITNTVNNYYYDSDGNKKESSGSDTLSDILSTLIKFIKTLVTEGLPAALEILQTLIKSLSSMISSALDGLNVGAGTTNGIIAVLKCIPASCWSLVVIAVIILVVVGVLKHIF